MKIKNINKILLSFGAIALVASPIAVAASCGGDSGSATNTNNTNTNNTNNTNTTTQKLTTAEKVGLVNDLFTLQKKSELTYAIETDASGNEVKLITAVEQFDKKIAEAKADAEPQATIDSYVVLQAQAQELLVAKKKWIDVNPGDAKWWYIQYGAMFHAGLYDTEQAVNKGDPDWKTDKNFVKFLRALGKLYLENNPGAAAIKTWADKYIAFATNLGTTTAYKAQLDNLITEFSSLDAGAFKFLIGAAVAMTGLRWGSGEFTDLGIERLLKPLDIKSSDLAIQKTSLVIPVTTRVGYGANSTENIKDGTLTKVEQDALNGKKVLSISSTSETSVKLPAGIYMDTEITDKSTPVSGAEFNIVRMPAGGTPVAFNDTEILVKGGKFGAAGTTFYFYKLDGKEYKFITKQLYDSLSAKTVQAVDALTNAQFDEKGGKSALFLPSSYASTTAAITTSMAAQPLTAFWSPITGGFTFVLPETTLLGADKTKTKQVYIYKLDANGQIPQSNQDLINKIVTSLKI